MAPRKLRKLSEQDLHAELRKYQLRAARAVDAIAAVWRELGRRRVEPFERVRWPWPCKDCGAGFATQAEFIEHKLSQHAAVRS